MFEQSKAAQFFAEPKLSPQPARLFFHDQTTSRRDFADFHISGGPSDKVGARELRQ
jgi:hypothetical protein